MTTTTERLINEAYKRLPDALELVNASKVEDIGQGEYIVYSQTKPDVWYVVGAKGCDCPDVLYRQTMMCKHRLATRIFRDREAQK